MCLLCYLGIGHSDRYDVVHAFLLLPLHKLQWHAIHMLADWHDDLAGEALMNLAEMACVVSQQMRSRQISDTSTTAAQHVHMPISALPSSSGVRQVMTEARAAALHAAATAATEAGAAALCTTDTTATEVCELSP